MEVKRCMSTVIGEISSRRLSYLRQTRVTLCINCNILLLLYK